MDYINLYVLTSKGVYRYMPESNLLKQLSATDSRSQVTPESIANAALMVLFTLDPTRLPSFVKPGTPGARELAIGTASYGAQNLALVASSLKLSSIVMYNMSATAAGAAKLAKDEVPLFIVQLGYTSSGGVAPTLVVTSGEAGASWQGSASSRRSPSSERSAGRRARPPPSLFLYLTRPG